MGCEDIQSKFLVIGRNRRLNKTPSINSRLPMGRKGIGKLAGFGIARKIDLITLKNGKLWWLKFDLTTMLYQSKENISVDYEPEVLADGEDIKSFSPEETLFCFDKELYDKFTMENNSGTLVVLEELSVSRRPNINRIRNSLSNIFALNLIKDEMTIYINNEEVRGKERLPPLQNFSIGTSEDLKNDFIIVDDKKLEIKYWVGFVDLKRVAEKQCEWSIENSGVAIYAHNKIVQERPFFFDVQGKEVVCRYLLGYVYADWLDDADDDLVSTDRSSLNWNSKSTSILYDWGKEQVKKWIKKFEEYKKSILNNEVSDIVAQVPAYQHILAPEADLLKKLLTEIFPSMEDDDISKHKACEVMVEAWVREPMQKEIRKLWNEINKDNVTRESIDVFVKIVDNLKNHLIPEMLDVAVTVAQRLHAIQQMQKILTKGLSETHLQRLIEDFPWLLGPDYTCLSKNQGFRKICQGLNVNYENGDENNDKTSRRPDFVFLSDAEERQVLVIELKGAEHGKTIKIDEYRQLEDYMYKIGVKLGSMTNVKGKLIIQTKVEDGFSFNVNKNIEILTWTDIFNNTARLHEALLKSLLFASKIEREDRRFKLIEEFLGGKLEEYLQILSQYEFIEAKSYSDDIPVRKK